jgi:hypothetical protein
MDSKNTSASRERCEALAAILTTDDVRCEVVSPPAGKTGASFVQVFDEDGKRVVELYA